MDSEMQIWVRHYRVVCEKRGKIINDQCEQYIDLALSLISLGFRFFIYDRCQLYKKSTTGNGYEFVKEFKSENDIWDFKIHRQYKKLVSEECR